MAGRIALVTGTDSIVWQSTLPSGGPQVGFLLYRSFEHLGQFPNSFTALYLNGQKAGKKMRNNVSTANPKINKPPNERLWEKLKAENQVGHKG